MMRMKIQNASERFVMDSLVGSLYWTKEFLFGVNKEAGRDKDFERKFYANKFSQIQSELQMKEHMDPAGVFFAVINGDIADVERRIGNQLEKDLFHMTDVAGASIVHVAYLYKQYHVAHYLVRKYPNLGLQPYSCGKPAKLLKKLLDVNIPKPDSYDMPYTGENILHMAIMRRNYAEVRWLLNIYRDHYSVDSPLAKLLNSVASGAMFQRNGVFYFGGYPLHFAACSNDKQIFDLVLSFCAHTVGGSLALDTQSIFLRDLYGNSILHLCVINCLEDMYKHVHATAMKLLTKQIIDLWTKRRSDRVVFKLAGFQ
jgi:hypothetical protein